MFYITGQHALNLQCSLNTCGDWHTSALKWNDIPIKSSYNSVFGVYGIEQNIKIPEHNERYNVANHIRALLDLLEQGLFTIARGMNNDYICNETYDNEIFNKVIQLKENSNWDDIDKFMEKEYLMKWIRFKRTVVF